MSSQNFKDEEVKFLREQHEKAKNALQEVERKITGAQSEKRELLISKETV